MGVQKISLNNYAQPNQSCTLAAATTVIISFDLTHTLCIGCESRVSAQALLVVSWKLTINARTHACTHVGTHTRMHAHIESHTHAHCPQCGNDNIDDVDLGQFTLNGLLLLPPLLLQLICCTIQLHFYGILLRKDCWCVHSRLRIHSGKKVRVDFPVTHFNIILHYYQRTPTWVVFYIQLLFFHFAPHLIHENNLIFYLVSC